MADEIMNEYEDLDNTIVLCDDEGNDVTMQFLDIIEYKEKEYVVLLPQENPDDAELVILEIALEGEDEVYLGIEDDDTANAVFEIFKEKYKDIINFAD